MNSSHIQSKLEQSPKLAAIFNSGRKSDEIVEELYLTVLSRFPTDEEVNIAAEYRSTVAAAPPVATAKSAPPSKPDKKAKPKGGGKYSRATKWIAPRNRNDWVDITWALLNSTEFLYRH